MSLNPPSFLDIPSRELKPMTEEQSKAFFTLFILEKQDNNDAALKLLKEVSQQSRQGEVTVKRLQLYGIYNNVSPALMVFIALIMRNFGELTLWTYTLHKALQSEHKTLNMDVFAELFPWGLPSDEQASKLWDEQKKLGDGNYLDSLEAYDLLEHHPIKFPL